MSCSSTVTVPLEELDVVHLIPPLQGCSQCDCTETSAHAGKLAVGWYRHLGVLLGHDDIDVFCYREPWWTQGLFYPPTERSDREDRNEPDAAGNASLTATLNGRVVSFHIIKSTRSMAPQKLSVLGRVSLIFRVCAFVVPAGLLNIVTATIRAWLQRLSIRACVRNAVARALMTHIPAVQIQTVLPSTVETYRAWVAPAEKSPLIQILPDGTTRLLWLGSREGAKVLLFFHGMCPFLLFHLNQVQCTDNHFAGGGYIMPLSPGHLNWMNHVRTKTSDACVGLDFFVCLNTVYCIISSPVLETY